MCRAIRPLHNFEPPATSDEIHEAAVQYVRKISGMTRPGKANEAAFARAVASVEAASGELLRSLVAGAPPHDRERERERARARWERRASRVAAEVAVKSPPAVS